MANTKGDVASTSLRTALQMNDKHDSESHVNGTPTSNDTTNGTPKSTPAKIESSTKGTPGPRGPRRPNYNEIHARKLPLDIYPLPTFQPHNPLSLVPFLLTVIRDFVLPRSSHAKCPYHGTFSSLTRSVHVTDPATVRALWESGFFGKGTLSRSEPNWLEGEKRRVGLLHGETAEQFSARRRGERMVFKRDRARIEKELIEELRVREAAGLVGLPGGEAADQIPVLAGTRARELMEQRAQEAKEAATTRTTTNAGNDVVLEMDEADLINQEHLQLTLEEAFFLTYALGSLHIIFPNTTSASNSSDLLDVFRRHSTFPPLSGSAPLDPDDPFLLSYITYHHFRSLGWVVRPGIKFAVDFLLYERGPVFTHATFAVLIVPSYSDPYWFATEERKKKVEKERKRRSWEWFHCANRVQNQVLKTLVLCYVDVPKPMEGGAEDGDVGRLLGSYRVREFCVKRWSANRNRE